MLFLVPSLTEAGVTNFRLSLSLSSFDFIIYILFTT